jgi:TonB-dependent SusC/RagA subfamily outer membrane receptor
MKLNRTNVVPVLAIVAGGAIGASLSFSFLALTRSGVEPEPFGTVTEDFSVAEEAVQLDPLVVPGTPGRVNIRGFSSILIGNQPLIYVDGIRVDDSFGLAPDNGSDGLRNVGGSGDSALDDISPEDIESIEIIKGPEAAKLYGTEASAGVIQIITKKERRR